MPKPNGAFSQSLPTLQTTWDSTSLGELKRCPRAYQLRIIEGWTPNDESHHLTFGRIYHSALELYDKRKALGDDHPTSQRAAVRHALEASWGWESFDPNKNRWNLVRSVSWYLDQFADDPLKTIILSDGKPAVELSFKFETEYSTLEGEPMWLAGHLDRVATLDGLSYVVDRKTSKNSLDSRFFENFTPDNQFSLYALASKVALNVPAVGLIVDAAQVAVGFTRFQRGTVLRSESVVEEWYQGLGLWLKVAELYALRGHWPMNDKACFGCSFRKVCTKGPTARDQWLSADFHRSPWDPTVPR